MIVEGLVPGCSACQAIAPAVASHNRRVQSWLSDPAKTRETGNALLEQAQRLIEAHDSPGHSFGTGGVVTRDATGLEITWPNLVGEYWATVEHFAEEFAKRGIHAVEGLAEKGLNDLESLL